MVVYSFLACFGLAEGDWLPVRWQAARLHGLACRLTGLLQANGLAGFAGWQAGWQLVAGISNKWAMIGYIYPSQE
jgi:hypothetical protein